MLNELGILAVFLDLDKDIIRDLQVPFSASQADVGFVGAVEIRAAAD